MLRLMEIALQMEEGQRIHQSMGSVMHGVLMEMLPADLAADLHTMRMRPYSQCIYYNKAHNRSYWRLGFLTDEIYEVIKASLLEEKSIFLKQRQQYIQLIHGEVIKESTFGKLADTVFADSVRTASCIVEFLTATRFKHADGYELFPDLTRIFNSLLNRWE